MLTIKAKIMFFNPKDSFTRNGGISTKNTLRPAFKFGEGLLFSGTIKNGTENEKYLYQTIYVVEVELPTIGNEAYKAIQPFIKIGMYLNIQTASKIIGEAKILEYKYSYQS